MLIPMLRLNAAILVSIVLVGCGSMVSYEDMEPVLDQMVGKPMPKSPYPLEWHFRKKYIDKESYELVSLRSDNCNYVVKVRAIDEVVLGWKFLESQRVKTCRFQHVRQLM